MWKGSCCPDARFLCVAVLTRTRTVQNAFMGRCVRTKQWANLEKSSHELVTNTCWEDLVHLWCCHFPLPFTTFVLLRLSAPGCTHEIAAGRRGWRCWTGDRRSRSEPAAERTGSCSSCRRTTGTWCLKEAKTLLSWVGMHPKQRSFLESKFRKRITRIRG